MKPVWYLCFPEEDQFMLPRELPEGEHVFGQLVVELPTDAAYACKVLLGEGEAILPLVKNSESEYTLDIPAHGELRFRAHPVEHNVRYLGSDPRLSGISNLAVLEPLDRKRMEDMARKNDILVVGGA